MSDWRGHACVPRSAESPFTRSDHLHHVAHDVVADMPNAGSQRPFSFGTTSYDAKCTDVDAAISLGSDVTHSGLNDHWTWQPPFEVFLKPSESSTCYWSAEALPSQAFQQTNPSYAQDHPQSPNDIFVDTMFDSKIQRQHFHNPPQDDLYGMHLPHMPGHGKAGIFHRSTGGLCSNNDNRHEVVHHSGTRFTSADSEFAYTPPQIRHENRCQMEGDGSQRAPKRPQLVTHQSSSSYGRASTARKSREASAQGAGEGSCVPLRPFSCPLAPYGCAADFTSKNEWKRHITSQHLCLGFWRCDLCPDAEARPNDFNRKDLFIQHLRRMHSGIKCQQRSGAVKRTKHSRHRHKDAAIKGAVQPDNASVAAAEFEQTVDATRARCWVQMREPPSRPSCVFCRQSFSGNGSLEKWLEHLGHHLSALAVQHRALATAQDVGMMSKYWASVVPWQHDVELKHWLIREGLLQPGQTPSGYRCAGKGSTHASGGVSWEMPPNGNEMGEEDAVGDLD